MTSFRQIEADRGNARKSTGPVTQGGKQHSRCNAVRHGLTAETVIGALEDAEDYRAFEAVVAAGFDAETALNANSCCDSRVCCGVCGARLQLIPDFLRPQVNETRLRTWRALLP
jgi:hypothetical protein